MKVNAIIAEFNPFHNGHKYLLKEAAKKNGADYTIVVMSGNFMQRGTPAIMDKFSRAKTALLNGADLVLELPIVYATASAEFFATGAVRLIDKLGVADNICFGSECGSVKTLTRLAEILLNEPEAFRASLKDNLKMGLSYPNARTDALTQYDPALSNCRTVLSTPNNILGIEYIKALLKFNSTIAPFTAKRQGADYHDSRFGNSQASATAIRVALSSGQDIDFLNSQMPDNAFEILKCSLENNPIILQDDFSESLYYKLLNEKYSGYDKYFDVSADLSDKILNRLHEYKSFSEFCDTLKSKDVTYTRISRCLLHILLNITDEIIDKYKALDYVPYARVLGFKKSSAELLSEIKKRSSMPMITKLADAENILSEDAYAVLKNELRMNDIYLSAVSLKSKQNLQNEISTPIVIV